MADFQADNFELETVLSFSNLHKTLWSIVWAEKLRRPVVGTRSWLLKVEKVRTPSTSIVYNICLLAIYYSLYVG